MGERESIMKITEVYRPRRLSEVAAQKSAVMRIENAVARRGLAGSSWWISGATGTGKTTIARILAEEFCGTDFTIVEFVGRDLLVDDIREYERRMALTPMGGGRCLVINEAQDLSDMSVSMLLSLVEKINESKYDMVVFTAMVDVLEKKNGLSLSPPQTVRRFSCR
jgi:replication-associated recombination protein RarA